jgi:two-component system sensor histidine kinase CiaH
MPLLRNRSPLFKLTAWYIAIIIVISLLFSGAVYHYAVDELSNDLTLQSKRIFTQYPVFDHDPFFMRHSDLIRGSHAILLGLVEFNAIVLVATGFASYWLAKRTLEPIEVALSQQKRFTSDASHELRTPLTALKMSTEVSLLDPASTKATLREALRSNLEEADKLDTLITNLLRLSRLEAHDIQIAFSNVSTMAIINTAVEHMATITSFKHISISTSGTTQPVSGDENSLVQLLVILLDNAVKYTPPNGSIVITSSIKDTHPVISIADSGGGIPAADIPHVFDRFYRADQARTRGDQPGYGLGLSIAKYIADLHNAVITLTSRESKGTTATITFAPLISGKQRVKR